jgi:Protein of unknown function (DUF1569)
VSEELIRLSDFDESLALLERLVEAPKVEQRGDWSLPTVLCHAAHSIEYSMSGYPRAKPAIFRATVGRLALRKFLRDGYMRHGRASAIPGEPAIPPTELEAAASELRRAIAEFRAFTGEPAPHFAYGPVTKTEYEKVHAMHLADHLVDFRIAD